MTYGTCVGSLAVPILGGSGGCFGFGATNYVLKDKQHRLVERNFT